MEQPFQKPPASYLDIFHSAQAKLVEGDIDEGRRILSQAIEAGAGEQDIQDFVWYMKGTEAYLNKDEVALQEAIENVQQPVNVGILQNFLSKLQSGQELNYSQDYGQGKL